MTNSRFGCRVVHLRKVAENKLKQLLSHGERWLVCGGGRHNVNATIDAEGWKTKPIS